MPLPRYCSSAERTARLKTLFTAPQQVGVMITAGRRWAAETRNHKIKKGPDLAHAVMIRPKRSSYARTQAQMQLLEHRPADGHRALRMGARILPVIIQSRMR
jgi:hypothetical protein